MRAAADDAEILSKLRWIRKLTVPLTAPVTAPLTAAAAVSETALTFLKTGFTVGKHVLVDSGTNQMVYRLGAIPSGSEAIPIVKWPTQSPHEIGALVRLLTEIDLGYIEDGGASLSASSSTGSVSAANARGKIWQSEPDIGDLSVSWGQRASSLENIASAYGMDESGVKGDGTTNNPYRLLVHPNTMGGQIEYAYWLSGLYKNNKVCNMLLLNPTPTIAVNTAFGAKNQPAVFTVGCLYTHKFTWID
jgi:hypothetical protein